MMRTLVVTAVNGVDGWLDGLSLYCIEVYVPVYYYTIDMLPRKAPHSLISIRLGPEKDCARI